MQITRRRAVISAAAAIGTFAIARRPRAEETLKIGVVS